MVRRSSKPQILTVPQHPYSKISIAVLTVINRQIWYLTIHDSPVYINLASKNQILEEGISGHITQLPAKIYKLMLTKPKSIGVKTAYLHIAYLSQALLTAADNDSDPTISSLNKMIVVSGIGIERVLKPWPLIAVVDSYSGVFFRTGKGRI